LIILTTSRTPVSPEQSTSAMLTKSRISARLSRSELPLHSLVQSQPLNEEGHPPAAR
jgi:hypothetical protein